MNKDYLKGRRTLIINALTAAVVILGGMSGQITDPDTLRIIAVVLAAANFGLRFLTTTPVGKTE